MRIAVVRNGLAVWAAFALSVTACSVAELDLVDHAAVESDAAGGASTTSGAAASGVPAELADAETGGPDSQLSLDPAAVHEVGSCYRRPAPSGAAVGVACGEPHTIEIYAATALPDPAGALYPEPETVTALCDGAFLRLTGVTTRLPAVLDHSIMHPSPETWAAGERDVVCWVEYPVATTDPLSAIDPTRAFGLAAVSGLRAGDCLVDFSASADTYRPVDCDEPHDAEVFTYFEFAAGEFPGDETVEATADELCFGQPFAAFVGVEYSESVIDALRRQPTIDTWAHGDRAVVCILTDELVRTGSLRGAAV